MVQDNFPKYLIIHHSWSVDSKIVRDWAGLRKYHMSYRYNGNIITREEWQQYASKGIKTGLETPWIDIGYHAGAEYVNGIATLQLGRPDIQHGAHCDEAGMNTASLGFCFVGNFDVAPPPEDLLRIGAKWAAEKCKLYKISVANILPHHQFASYKTCPGSKFSMVQFDQMVKGIKDLL